jgi:hypothetical protein
MRPTALALCIALVSGCFAYNPSGKKWAYAGDVLLMAGGGGAIALDVTNKPEACTGTNCPYVSPIHGGLVAGALLVGAGLFGIIFNATRDNVKGSR